MIIRRPWVIGLVYTLAAAFCPVGSTPSTALAQAPPDTLALQKPENVTVWRTYDAARNQFTVYVRWEDPPDSVAALIHPADTTGWRRVSPPDSLSMPSSRGWYRGDIDRTVFVRSLDQGQVGQGQIRLEYNIEREDNWNSTLDIGAPYTPGQWLPLIFVDRDFYSPTFGDSLDLALEVSFSPGIIDAQGKFIVGLEDFEGFHVWRGIRPDGSDLEVIGEISKEEAFKGTGPGGNPVDSLYLYAIIPALRSTGVYHSPFSIDCLGFTIRAQLEDNELLWFDCNAFNGFTYYYLVTTFDRGYGVASGRQGLIKFDRCQPMYDEALPDSCRDELVQIGVQVDAQNNLSAVYAVPNPYRTGGSRLTTEQYHNFPDDKIRFVNVPANCKIKIFTVAGDLVWEWVHQGGGNIEWDATNRGGETVTSGVYIFKVEDPIGGEVYGRLVIIR